jgi:hypothetical protein
VGEQHVQNIHKNRGAFDEGNGLRNYCRAGRRTWHGAIFQFCGDNNLRLLPVLPMQNQETGGWHTFDPLSCCVTRTNAGEAQPALSTLLRSGRKVRPYDEDASQCSADSVVLTAVRQNLAALGSADYPAQDVFEYPTFSWPLGQADHQQQPICCLPIREKSVDWK